jgi:hypothetical protein
MNEERGCYERVHAPAPEGRPWMAALLGLFRRHRVASAVVIFGADFLVGALAGVGCGEGPGAGGRVGLRGPLRRYRRVAAVLTALGW